MASMMDLSTGSDSNPLAWLAPFLTGIGNVATAGGDMTAAREASNMADPWASNRSQYQTGLNSFMADPATNPFNATAGTAGALGKIQALLADPNSVTKMPGYQYGLDQSLEAVNRGAGASGMLNSGNRLTALQDRGQSYAKGWYDDTYNQLLQNLNGNLAAGNQWLGAQGQAEGQLANLAGVNAGSPVAAAQALINGRQNQSNSIGAGIGGIANGVGGLLSSLPAIQRLLSGGGMSGSAGGEPFGTGGDWGGMSGSYGGEMYGTGGDTGGFDFMGTGGDSGFLTAPDDYSWLMDMFGGGP